MGIWKRDGSGLAGASAAASAAVPPAGNAVAANDLLAPGKTLRTSLGEDSEVTGRLSFTSPTRIDGKLRGEVSSSDLLVIGETGCIDGQVRSQSLLILGVVKGDVSGSRIEIGPGGRLEGTVTATALSVRDGGRLDGDCRVTPPRAQVHVLDEHRDKPDKAE